MAKKDINFNTYVERDLTKTNIDWGAVSKNLSESLIKIEDERKKKRAEIETNTLETEGILTTLEEYDNTQLGELALGMSNESAQFLRVQSDLFKRGLISQTDFAQAKQRVLSDWKQFSNVSKQWNTDYAEYVKRLDSGEASSLEEWLNSQNEAFGNLENMTGYVNPQTGRLSLVEVDPTTGLPSDDPGKHVSMNTINNRLKTKYNDVNVPEVVKDSVDYLGALLIEELGSRQEVIGEKGWGTKKDDPEFQKQMRERARTLMTPANKAVIAGQLNEGKYTYNVNEVTPDSDIVLMEINKLGIPVPAKNPPNKEKIDKMVEDMLYGEMMLQLDAEYTVEKGYEVTSKLADERVRGNIDSQAYRDELAGAELNLKEKRLKLDQEVAAGNIDAQVAATQLARDNYKLNVLKYETNEGLVNAQIDKIYADIDLSDRKQDLAELTGDRNYKIALMNETYKSKLLKEKEKEGIVPFTYPDPNKTSVFDGTEQTGRDFIEDEVGNTIQLNSFWWSPENTADLSASVGKYVQGMLDPNVYNQLAETGGFDVKWEKGPGGKDSQAGGIILTVGGVDYKYPPQKASDAEIAKLMREDKSLTREEVEKTINDANGYNEFTAKGFKSTVGRGGPTTTSVPSDVFFGWINKFVLDPATTAAIALQEPPEEDEVNYIERIQGAEGDSIFETEE
jgi:hypothetical protein